MNTNEIFIKKSRRMYPRILKERFSILSSPITVIFNFYSKIQKLTVANPISATVKGATKL